MESRGRSLSALDPIWDELYPAEQSRLLDLIIERIDVSIDGVVLQLHANGVRTLGDELAGRGVASPTSNSADHDQPRRRLAG